ncbi:MAG: hypothetical protein II916_11435, partial [Oscillospiraceae bacterium]|nr:hypothetical protein [Oscillospiraceae bacterium]
MNIEEQLNHAVRTIRMPEDARHRLSAKIASLPEDGEVYQAEVEKTPVIRYLLTGLAACAMLAVTGLGIWQISRARPLINPAAQLSDAPESREVYTPFGDLTVTRPYMTYPDDTTRGAEEQLREQVDAEATLRLQRWLTEAETQALEAVFENYGWCEQAEPEAVCGNIECITMELHLEPERFDTKYLTATFQVDPALEEHYVMVQTNAGTKWYALDEELIRCLQEIVVFQNTDVEYAPPERAFSDVFMRIRGIGSSDGTPIPCTDGQQAALSDLLNANTLYEYNTLRSADPAHGESLTVHLQTDDGEETLVFWLDTDCLMYEAHQVSHEEGENGTADASVPSRRYYWVNEDTFMLTVKHLLIDGIYPTCPMGELDGEEFSVDGVPLSDAQAASLREILTTNEWRAIECPVNSEFKAETESLCITTSRGELHCDPEHGYMEWREEREGYGVFTPVSPAEPDAWNESHMLCYPVPMPPELWDAIRSCVPLPEKSPTERDIPYV